MRVIRLLPWLIAAAAGQDACPRCNATTRTELPLIVMPGTRIEIFIDLINFELATEEEADKWFDQISFVDASNCELTFNAFTGAEGLTRDNFGGSTASKCKDGDGDYTARSDQWKAKYIGNKVNEVGFQIENAEYQDSGEWTVTIASQTGGAPGTDFFPQMVVWVVEAPRSLNFEEEEFQDGDGLFEVTDSVTPSMEEITCKAVHVRPAPTFFWTIGERDIDSLVSMNYTDVSSIIEDDFYLNVSQKVEFIPEPWMDGETVRCRIDITDNQGNSMIGDIAQNEKEITVNFTVHAPPVPPEVPEVHPEGDFIEGEDALVIFYFHANPGPTELVWNLADIAENLTSTETNMTATAGRYTSEGWNATVDGVEQSRSGVPGNPGNSFMARLRIRELTEEDSGLTHNLTITNPMGSTSYLIRIHDITAAGLSTGAIAGIVVGCILALVLIGVAVLMFVRNKNGKKSKKIRQKKKEEKNQEDRRV